VGSKSTLASSATFISLEQGASLAAPRIGLFSTLFGLPWRSPSPGNCNEPDAGDEPHSLESSNSYVAWKDGLNTQVRSTFPMSGKPTDTRLPASQSQWALKRILHIKASSDSSVFKQPMRSSRRLSNACPKPRASDPTSAPSSPSLPTALSISLARSEVTSTSALRLSSRCAWAAPSVHCCESPKSWTSTSSPASRILDPTFSAAFATSSVACLLSSSRF